MRFFDGFLLVELVLSSFRVFDRLFALHMHHVLFFELVLDSALVRSLNRIEFFLGIRHNFFWRVRLESISIYLSGNVFAASNQIACWWIK